MDTASLQPAMDGWQRVVVLVLAWQPDAALLAFVPELIRRGFRAVIVVDDGSGPEYQDLFEILAGYREAHLVRHAVHRGKGRAWKSGLSYCLNAFPDFRGMIIANADGRHTPEDILLTAQAWSHSPQHMIAGARQFSGAVPWRSRLEYRIINQVFGLLAGRKLADPQSGLYAIPRAMIPSC